MLGTCASDWLHNLQALVQNEDMGLLVQELLRISKWQQQSFTKHVPLWVQGPWSQLCLYGTLYYKIKNKQNRFPVCILRRSLFHPNEQGGSQDTSKLPFQIYGLKTASGGCLEKFKHKGILGNFHIKKQLIQVRIPPETLNRYWEGGIGKGTQEMPAVAGRCEQGLDQGERTLGF